MKILIVEDSPMTRLYLVKLCAKVVQAEVIEAVNLWEAALFIETNEFDLITWDYNLPDGNSLDLIRTAKKKFPKAIMIAASSVQSNRQKQLEAGCTMEAGLSHIGKVIRDALTSSQPQRPT